MTEIRSNADLLDLERIRIIRGMIQARVCITQTQLRLILDMKEEEHEDRD